MLNINEKMDYVDETEKGDKLEEETQNKYEVYNANLNVNFFGVGRGAEDL